MTHLLDTNICSAHMRRPGGLAHRFFQYAGGIAISTVVLAELYSGAYKHPNPSRLLALIADLLQEVAVLDFDSACAEQFGKVRGGNVAARHYGSRNRSDDRLGDPRSRPDTRDTQHG